jgi:hypothetical protein
MQVEYGAGSLRVRRTLVVLGALYILAVFCEGSTLRDLQLNRLLYRPVLFFCQIAALFPNADIVDNEFRAEGFTCNGRVVEIDVRPFFPIHAEDKESRFDRAMYFYRNDRTSLEAVEAYLIRERNKVEPEKIGGVRFVNLRVPIPPVGSPPLYYSYKDLSAFPKDQRKVMYSVSSETVARRCKEGT